MIDFHIIVVGIISNAHDESIYFQGDGIIMESSECWEPLSEDAAHTQKHLMEEARGLDSSILKIRRKGKEAEKNVG